MLSNLHGGDVHACQWRRAGQRFRGHDQLGRRLDFDGHDVAVATAADSYSVKGSHTYCQQRFPHHHDHRGGIQGGGGSMSALAVASTSSVQPADRLLRQRRYGHARPAGGIGLLVRRSCCRNAVDQVLSTTTVNRSRRALHTSPNDAALDDLFALG